VLEQRVTTILDRILIKPSLASLPPLEEGGLLQVSVVLDHISIVAFCHIMYDALLISN
jgi:hypothetical protein